MEFLKELMLHCNQMNLQKIKTSSYCVGGSHRSATTDIYGDKTSKGDNLITGYCSVCY